MLDSDPGAGLIGRRSDCDVLDRVLKDVRAHKSSVLVLRGEAGIGKTALVEYLARTASGCRVIRAAGVQSEVELAFAGAHQLCAPILDRTDALPGPQRDALGTAFGLAAGLPADRFLVGLAVLTLMSAAAEDQPLVCLIDDAQWLDQVSGQILAFVARRLLAESIALVFSVREPGAPPALTGLPEHTVGGLADGDARALLDSVYPGRLDERVRDRIVAESRGNPLALIELPRGSTAGELAGGFAVPGRGPLAGQIEHGFLTRVRALPDETQRLLLIAAAEPLGDGILLQRAANLLGIGTDARSPAEEDGLIEFGARVRFRHPLVRSAAYRAGSVADRQAVHQALAEVTDPLGEPDRRAWHRAHAAAALDEDVALDLERSAERARSRGGAAAAAAFLEQAFKLTVDPGARSVRALLAAQAKFAAADYDAADALATAAELGPLDDLLRAQLARLRAQIVFDRSRGRDAPPLFLEAAKRLKTLDDQLARETYLQAMGAAIFAGRFSTDPNLAEIAETARAASAVSPHAGPVDLLLDAVARRFTDGYTAAASHMRRVLEVFRRHADDGDQACARWFWLAWLVAADLWDDGLLDELATRALRQSRAAGALEQVPIALAYRAAVHIYAGELGAAVSLIEESDSITTATGYAPLGYPSVLLDVWRGDEDEVLSRLSWALPNAGRRGEGRGISQAEYCSAILYNGLGRYDEALAGARAACEHDDLGVRGYALVELIEAAAHGSAPEVAEASLRELEERALAAGTDWALGMLDRSTALVASGEAAELRYRSALDRLSRTRVVVQLARAHLIYGEWLRRENRRRDARTQLRVAYDLFHRMGAEAFAERARRELVATGETARPRTADASADLTPQEAQIARLAVEGWSNAEIGTELFLSSRTVEYHLSKVYTKLGVGSRRELRRSMPRVHQIRALALR